MSFLNQEALRTFCQIRPRLWFLVITFVLSTVVSGSLTEMVLNPERFWVTGTSKVVLAAFILTLPVWSVNTLLTWTLLRKGGNRPRFQVAMAGSGLFTSVIFLITVLMAAAKVIDDSVSFICCISFFELFFVCSVIWSGTMNKTALIKIRRSLLHIVLAVLNVISFLFILQIVFGCFPLISCSLGEERVNLINGFVVDMSVGIITSTFFYYLLVYLPEKRRNKQVRLINQGRINFLCSLMQVVVGYFCDKYQLKYTKGDLLDADFSNIPSVQLIGQEPITFWYSQSGDSVSDLSGSTEIGFLAYYLIHVKDWASKLYASNVLALDDLELLSAITQIKDSKLASSVDTLNRNRGIKVHIPALSQEIVEFFELYKSLAEYAEIREIVLKGEKPANVIPLEYP